MNILDSSAWIEFFAGGSNKKTFAVVVEKFDELMVPSITIYEVFKKFILEFGRDQGLEVANFMQGGKVVDLNSELSIFAAALSKEFKLGMADSIILATAKKYNATIWTMDSDFKGMPNVKYFPKR